MVAVLHAGLCLRRPYLCAKAVNVKRNANLAEVYEFGKKSPSPEGGLADPLF
jgi:hypothetical protein